MFEHTLWLFINCDQRQILLDYSNSDLCQNCLINIINLFADEKDVLRDTSIGHMRKLSLYRTKRRKVEVRDTDNLQSEPNFMRLDKEAKEGNVNILDTTSEESDGSVNLNTSINSNSESQMLVL